MQCRLLLTHLLVGWGNFGGSGAGGVDIFAADTASSAGKDTNLGSKTALFPPRWTHLPLPPACCVGLHILACGEPGSCPAHPSRLKGGE